jgi:DNA-binding transcriptional regulator GbsR (MarR family)
MESYQNSEADYVIGHTFENMPDRLKADKRWMGTRLEELPNGKWSKPPYRVRVGRPVVKADKTNPENYATFEEALEALTSGAVDAIGFVFTNDDPLTVVDLDDAVDPETGEIDAWASNIQTRFDTYWEISVSGRGLHIICEAQKPGSRCRTGNVELYDGRSGARFMVLTGRGSGRDISRCQEAVDTLYRDLFGEDKPPPDVTPGNRVPVERSTIVEKARNSKTGAKFVKLYDQGDRSGFDSPNEADYALINMLIFWCAGDERQVEDLFRSSALYRPPPEKHKGYVGISVRNALASYRGSYYQPKVLREESTPKQRDVLTPYLTLLLDASLWKGPRAPAAYKGYAALVIEAVEDGIKTDTEELRIGLDVRTIAERAGLNRVTLCRSALPYLVEKKLITWKRGRGNKAGEFVLRKPKVPAGATIKVSTHYFNGSTCGDGLDALARLIRMRSGVSRTGRVTHLGEMQNVARLGMVAMFAMVSLTTTPRGLNIDGLVERTGRRKDHLRITMRKLVDAQIVEESRKDFFTLVPAFWLAYDKELLKSGIVAAERRQKKQHKKERVENELKLKHGREKAKQKADPRVIDLAAKRRQKLDREAARRQFVQDERFLSEEQLQDLMQEEYDRMCERVQERLGSRRRPQTKGGVS